MRFREAVLRKHFQLLEERRGRIRPDASRRRALDEAAAEPLHLASRAVAAHCPPEQVGLARTEAGGRGGDGNDLPLLHLTNDAQEDTVKRIWHARAAGRLLASGVVALAAYLLLIRPWQLRWGATDEEVERAMPGDDVVQRPTFVATRAVTIQARPEEIWPWLVQIGFRRAGWYSYDWIDNFGTPSAARIIPDLQHLAVGDFIPMGPAKEFGLWVKAFEPNRWLLWGDKKGETTWLWALSQLDEVHTRLISRVRIRYNCSSPAIIFNLILDVGDIVMMRKCMLGIKRRAEAAAARRGEH